MKFAIPTFLLALTLATACCSKHNNATINFADMDTTVRPQDDFYNYANGRWTLNHPMPDDYSSYDVADVLTETTYQQILDIITEVTTHPQKPGSSAEKLAQFYLSGMDTATINAAGIEPIRFFLDTIDAIQRPADLQNAITLLQKHYFISPFFILYGPYLSNGDVYALVIGEEGIGLDVSEYYLEDDEYSVEIREEYKKHIRNLFVLMGQDSATAQRSAMAAYGIEHRIAEITLDKVEQFNPTGKLRNVTVDELGVMMPTIDWPKYFSQLNLPIPDTIVLDSEKSYFVKLDKMMNQVPINDWKAFLKLKVLLETAKFLDSGFAREWFHFDRQIMGGQVSMPPRWKLMIEAMKNNFDDVISELYIERHFPQETKNHVVEIAENVRAALAEHISQATWMQDSTKAKALKKLSCTRLKIGYPPQRNDFSSLTMCDNFTTNVLNVLKNNFEYEMSFIGKVNDHSQWYEVVPFEANIYNVANQNEVILPAAFMQPPYFFANGDDAVNYGSLGAALGHEMTHGFDPQGRQYGNHGELSDWWAESDKEAFDCQLQKLIDRFNSFIVIDSMHADGEFTVGENTADLGGLVVAYTAFSKTEQWKDQTKLIDGLTPDQRFFIAYAQSWAGSYRDEEIRNRTKTDPHSLVWFRIEGPLPNIDAFVKAFNVKPGDRYYLPDSLRAKIW
ncbi:MAG: M13 family metallopeptidase [Salinivirgaceae bacterium]|nr:M13 family metallopeptidase [Salinivirgaceae bacterium]